MGTVQADRDFTLDGDRILITAYLKGGGPPRLLEGLTRALKRIEGPVVTIDLAGVDDIDSLGASLLSELEVRARTAGKQVSFSGANPAVQHGIDRYLYPAPEIRLPGEERDRLVSIGGEAVRLWESLGDLLLLVSESLYWSVVALWRADGHRRGAITRQALTIGVSALPVIATLAFLIGLILALQSAEQLRQFGANIYVADLVAISMAREMGPLITAILLAGRSGSAIAAEVATMTVTEEIDAIRTMGLNPIRYVVVPKVWGITLTAPLLTILAVILGIAGGFVVATTTLELSRQAFISQVSGALFLKDILTGLIKSLVFAWLIVILAAYFGFRVRGGAEGVGRATTASVVATIFAVIVADCLLGLLFY